MFNSIYNRRSNTKLTALELQAVGGGDFCICGEVVMRSRGKLALNRVLFNSLAEFQASPYLSGVIRHRFSGTYTAQQCQDKCLETNRNWFAIFEQES